MASESVAAWKAILMTDPNRSLRKHLANLLNKAEAHADVRSALKDFPTALRGQKPAGSPHTPWQLLEHMRIAQWDILKFSVDSRHISPKFPEGYWPKQAVPLGDSAWNESLKKFLVDLDSMKKLVSDPA